MTNRSVRSMLAPESLYADIDPGIRFAVRVLHARGVDTQQSCEGGEGHAYDHPTIDLPGSSSRTAGFEAASVLHDYGLRVRAVDLHWPYESGLPYETFWRVTLKQPWPERADEKPAFTWGYVAADVARDRRDGMSEREPKTAYAVSTGDHSDYAVMAIFDTEERAEAWIETQDYEDLPSWYQPRIESFDYYDGDVLPLADKPPEPR